MSTRNTATYKQLLQAQRATLLSQLASLRGGQVGRAEASAAHFGEREPDSRAQMESERGLEFTLDARESAELDAIDAALQRIETGDYGDGMVVDVHGLLVCIVLLLECKEHALEVFVSSMQALVSVT